MKKKILKSLGITISLIMIMQSTFVFETSEKEQLQNQKDKNDQLIEHYNKKQDELEAQKSATMKSVEDLMGKISESESEIDLLESKVNDLQAKIK